MVDWKLEKNAVEAATNLLVLDNVDPDSCDNLRLFLYAKQVLSETDKVIRTRTIDSLLRPDEAQVSADEKKKLEVSNA